MSEIEYKEQTSLDNVKKIAARSGIIVYAVHTCWWTASWNDVYKLPELGVPCDPRGSVLMQTDKPDQFIAAAEANPDHYGKYGLQAFMAAYHGNVRVADNHKPTSLEGWEAYNKLIDEAMSRKEEESESED